MSADKGRGTSRNSRGPLLSPGKDLGSLRLFGPNDLLRGRSASLSRVDDLKFPSNRGRSFLAPGTDDQRRSHSLNDLHKPRKTFLPSDIGLNVKVQVIEPRNKPSFLPADNVLADGVKNLVYPAKLFETRKKPSLFSPSDTELAATSDGYNRGRNTSSHRRSLPADFRPSPAREKRLLSPFYSPLSDYSSDDSQSDHVSSNTKKRFVSSTSSYPFEIKSYPAGRSKTRSSTPRSRSRSPSRVRYRNTILKSSRPGDSSSRRPTTQSPRPRASSPRRPTIQSPRFRELSPRKPTSQSPRPRETSPRRPTTQSPRPRESSPSRPTSRSPRPRETSPRRPTTGQSVSGKYSPKADESPASESKSRRYGSPHRPIVEISPAKKVRFADEVSKSNPVPKHTSSKSEMKRIALGDPKLRRYHKFWM